MASLILENTSTAYLFFDIATLEHQVEKPGLLDGLECLLRQFGEIENRRFASVTIAGCGARNITAEICSGER
ncbi:MAG: hypothetical protein ABSD49_01360 [Candidatus Bathyarchaeia archaeon]|jgi:hypothetical protein